MVWQRARSDDQIEQRINAIVESAATLFDELRFDEITFAMIGKKACFTRSNLYRYFKTKEEVYLSLLVHDVVHWRQASSEVLVERSPDVESFSSLWVDLMMAHPRMLKLFGIVYTLLEHNVSDDCLFAFKSQLMSEVAQLSEVLVDQLPFASADQASNFIITQNSLVSGMYPMLHMTEKQKGIMLRIGVEVSEAHYRRLLVQSVESLLNTFLTPSE